MSLLITVATLIGIVKYNKFFLVTHQKTYPCIVKTNVKRKSAESYQEKYVCTSHITMQRSKRTWIVSDRKCALYIEDKHAGTKYTLFI